jgi:hypothetical protein
MPKGQHKAGLEYTSRSGDHGEANSRIRSQVSEGRREVTATYVFRLVVADPIDDQAANRLFDVGVGDGYPETGPMGHSIGFDREASSFREAVLSAIKDIEWAGFKVLRVEPDELVPAADIADRTGRSRQSVSALINGSRGPGNWPRPVAGNVRSPLWRWADVQAWFQGYDGSQEVNEEEAALIAAINDLIAARDALEHLKKRDRATLVRQLVTQALSI